MSNSNRKYVLRGQPTGYSYSDGSPVRVGDKLSLEGTDHPGTVRARYAKSGNLSFYITYSEGDTLHHRGMKNMEFVPYEDLRKPAPKPKEEHVIAIKEKGLCIVGLMDYDTPIYVKL